MEYKKDYYVLGVSYDGSNTYISNEIGDYYITVYSGYPKRTTLKVPEDCKRLCYEDGDYDAISYDGNTNLYHINEIRENLLELISIEESARYFLYTAIGVIAATIVVGIIFNLAIMTVIGVLSAIGVTNIKPMIDYVLGGKECKKKIGYHFDMIKVKPTPKPTPTQNNNKPTPTSTQKPNTPKPNKKPGPIVNGWVVAPFDPNDIIGPAGHGDEHWISRNSVMNYTIRFENDEEIATAPAQRVVIEQILDEDLDIRTFRLGGFGFGNRVFNVPQNRSFYQDRLDLTEELGICVDVKAGIDMEKRKAFWILQSIDPKTGLAPSDPYSGFLPPDINEGEGQGFVTYSIEPDSSLKTEAVIDAKASIVFDLNEVIDTPPIFNTIDAGVPTSNVVSLPEKYNSTDVILSVKCNDDKNGSGVKAYSIFVSTDDSPFEFYTNMPEGTDAVFYAEAGRKYGFYSIATDYAGNNENSKNIAESSTIIKGDASTRPSVTPVVTRSPEPVTTPITSTPLSTSTNKNTTTSKPTQTLLTPTPKPTSKPAASESGTKDTPTNSASSSNDKADTTTDNSVLPIPTSTTIREIIEGEDKMPGGIIGERKAYLKGYPGGKFEPDKEITRAEAAAIVAKLADKQRSPEGASITYPDVGDSHWAKAEIQFVSQKGLFRGYEDGTFKPDQKITRAEFAIVVANFLELTEFEIAISKFTDVEGHWAEKSINALVQKKIISGYEDGTFKPQANIKRSESVVLVNRALKRGPLYGAGQIFNDVPESHWAYKDVASGAMDYKYVIDENGHEKLIQK